jgi:hypothetical protein
MKPVIKIKMLKEYITEIPTTFLAIKHVPAEPSCCGWIVSGF